MKLEKHIEHIDNKVDKSNGCWIFTGKRDWLGYGVKKLNKKYVYVHRFMYSVFNGPLEDGKVVMHTCDNPSCVNPEHLVQGTHKDNVQDCISKGRFKAGRKKLV